VTISGHEFHPRESILGSPSAVCSRHSYDTFTGALTPAPHRTDFSRFNTRVQLKGVRKSSSAGTARSGTTRRSVREEGGGSTRGGRPRRRSRAGRRRSPSAATGGDRSRQPRPIVKPTLSLMKALTLGLLWRRLSKRGRGLCDDHASWVSRAWGPAAQDGRPRPAMTRGRNTDASEPAAVARWALRRRGKQGTDPKPSPRADTYR
jgi:hypothetical protein